MRIIIIVFLLLTACGKSPKPNKATYKELFSSWSNSAATMDLTGISFGNHQIAIEHSSNSGCICTLSITGDQESGNASLSSCYHYGPVDMCSSGTHTYVYTNVNATLTICEGSACEVYR